MANWKAVSSKFVSKCYNLKGKGQDDVYTGSAQPHAGPHRRPLKISKKTCNRGHAVVAAIVVVLYSNYILMF